MAGSEELLLVLCRANLIRSPLAAALLRHELRVAGRQDLLVESAGTEADAGMRSPDVVLQVAADRDIHLGTHTSRPVTGEQVAGAALVVTMTESQRDVTSRLSPGAVARTFTLHELLRLLEGSGTVAGTWSELARTAQSRRPLVLPATRPEDVPDPVGLTVYQHSVVADELARWATRMMATLRAPQGVAGQ